ncbi:hypothetical protein L1987_43363 [Smallanthus sonchifolius]|uniref:Uncharacterized protein n=1 Tax=Smallanthus sonchifolius TaxID=185202 RepID=A0ACB9GL74_9ASTR|nr:hypothetical protein L1987_43363 [Smallanthus sonchifolius]
MLLISEFAVDQQTAVDNICSGYLSNVAADQPCKRHLQLSAKATDTLKAEGTSMVQPMTDNNALLQACNVKHEDVEKEYGVGRKPDQPSSSTRSTGTFKKGNKLKTNLKSTFVNGGTLEKEEKQILNGTVKIQVTSQVLLNGYHHGTPDTMPRIRKGKHAMSVGIPDT